MDVMVSHRPPNTDNKPVSRAAQFYAAFVREIYEEPQAEVEATVEPEETAPTAPSTDIEAEQHPPRHQPSIKPTESADPHPMREVDMPKRLIIKPLASKTAEKNEVAPEPSHETAEDAPPPRPITRSFASFLQTVQPLLPESDELIHELDDFEDVSPVDLETISPPITPSQPQKAARPLSPKSDTVSASRLDTADPFGMLAPITNSNALSIYSAVPQPPAVKAKQLKAAQDKLAQLPTDSVPPIGPLPAGSRVPLEPNPLFMGRDDELCAIAETIKTGRPVVISQMDTTVKNERAQLSSDYGGVGKTQLASEFAHRYGHYFSGGVFWLNFANPSDIPAEIIAIGSSLASTIQPDFRNLLLEEQLRLVLSAWQSELPRLLIFDDCPDPALLKRWLPPQGGCHVLVTSRETYWPEPSAAEPLYLKSLERADSINLLKFYRPDHLASEQDTSDLAAAVGDLPLALRLVGNFLMTYRNDYSTGTYLKQLKRFKLDTHPQLNHLAEQYSETHHDFYVMRALAMSLDQFDGEDPTDVIAQNLLTRAAFFAPGVPIPKELLLGTLKYDAEQPDTKQRILGRLKGFLGTNSPDLMPRAQDALAKLVMLGLLETATDGALYLHPFLGQCLRDMTTDSDPKMAVQHAISMNIERLKQSGSPTALLAWQPHLRAIETFMAEDESGLPVGLPGPFGQHLVDSRSSSWERIYYERALAINEQLMGENHPDVAQSLDNLGVFSGYHADHLSSQFYFERALAIRLAEVGENHPDTARSFNNYGALLATKGEYERAKEHHEKALEIRRAVRGQRHPEVAQSLNNLGEVAYQQRELQQAQHHFEDALLICQQTIGHYHPETARILNNLAAALEAQEAYPKAAEAYQRALLIFKTVIGPHHTDVATVLNNLASLSELEGKFEEAKNYGEEALAIRQVNLGDKHPDTATSLHNLAVLHYRLESYDRAKRHMQQAIAIREAVLLPGHPHTQASLEDLAHIESRTHTRRNQFGGQRLRSAN